MRRWLVALAILLAAPAGAQDQPVQPRPAQTPEASQPATSGGQAGIAPDAVYLVTMGQGDEIWERFGHNFLTVPDPATGRHIAYNWGVFDFAAPDFLSRFLLGDTRYWMQGDDLAAVLQYYQRFNRPITLQRLNLTPAQVDSLRRFLAWNALPENRYYRYDYFRDNCSTRLRDALDRALGGALREQTRNRITNLTYRNESVRLTDEAPAAQLGINVALGQPADVPLSAWDAMFIPMRMQEYIREVAVPNAAGAPVPLVAEERVVFRAQRAPELTRAPGMMWEHAAAGLLIAALIAVLGWYTALGHEKVRVAFGAAGALWGVFAGMLGIVLLLAWVATQHTFWYRNENLLHLNPFSIALAVLLPLSLRRPRWWVATRVVAYGLAAVSCLGAAFKFMPWMMQDNWTVIVFALPVHLALAWAVLVVSRGELRVARGEPRRPGDRRRARRLSEKQ